MKMHFYFQLINKEKFILNLLESLEYMYVYSVYDLEILILSIK